MMAEIRKSADLEQFVKVLYDYTYTEDDNNKVTINVDEVFHLLNTESQEWWQVSRLEDPDNMFYVPSTYVEVMNSGSDHSHERNDNTTTFHPGHNGSGFGNRNSGNTELNKVNNNVKMDNHQNNDSDDQDDSNYMNVDTFKKDGSDFTVRYVHNTRPSDDCGEYANLDDFRKDANIPQPANPQPSQPIPQESDYANLEQLRIDANINPPQPRIDPTTNPDPQQPPPSSLRLEPAPPDVEQCQFKQTLTDKSSENTWDQYLDPATNRLFYMHNTTKEIQWKPPRGGQFHKDNMQKPEEDTDRYSGEYEDVEIMSPPHVSPQRKSRSVDFGRPSLTLNIPEGFSYGITEEGEAEFTDKRTDKKWIRAKDTTGHDYYYRWHSGTFDSVWQLPSRSAGNSPTKSPNSDPEDQFGGSPTALTSDQPPSTLKKVASTDKLRARSSQQVSDRFNKSRSVMINSLTFNAPPHSAGQGAPKSATLPPNFHTAIPEVPVEEQGSRRGSGPESHQSQPLKQSVNLNEPIEGVLNKCVLNNGKKSAKKWAYSYVKLSGSNLLLYKEQKISQKSQPGQIVALVECRVEKDSKTFTSKKNTICITNSEYHILLQADDDAKSTEWFIKLHTKIKELGGNPDPIQPDGSSSSSLAPSTPENMPSRKPSFKNKHRRTNSDAGNVEKNSKVRGILKTFINNRSDKEKLVKKGIYKDAVFGSEIKQLCDKEKSKVPGFISQSIDAIEKRGLDHEGLYRIGGNVSQIQKLRCMVDQGEKIDLHDHELWDVNVLSGCLKLFFRELKEPLFTYSLFDRFLKSFLKENASDRLKAIRSTVNELPKCNYETVKVLFKHLTNVVDNSAENKMQAHQLAIVFGPTLIWPEVQTQNLATSMVYQSRIVEYILMEYKNIFR